MVRVGQLLHGASLLTFVATTAAAGTALAQEAPSGRYSYYIAFGDSYSSGVGATTWKAGDPCFRSDLAWTSIVNASLGTQPFVKAACSGATSQDVLAQGPKYQQQGQQSQVALLPPAEQLKGALITIQIGGNDIRHESECLMGAKLLNGEHGAIPEACDKIDYAYANMQETVELLGSELDYLYQNLRVLAPEATIVAIGYPHLVNVDAPECASTTLLNITGERKKIFNAIVDAGNEQIKDTAANLGIPSITKEIATLFDGHEVCTTDEWIVSVDQLRSFEEDERTRAGHPNDLGHQKIAEVVLANWPSVPVNNGTVIPDEGGEVDEPGTEEGDDGEAGGGEDSEEP